MENRYFHLERVKFGLDFFEYLNTYRIRKFLRYLFVHKYSENVYDGLQHNRAVDVNEIPVIFRYFKIK